MKTSPTLANSSVQKALEKGEKLTFKSFAFPQQVEGCSCYFGATRKEFINQNYIYVDDFEKSVFLQLGDNGIQIKYGDKNEVTGNDSLILESKGKDFNLLLKAKKIDQGEVETALYQGKMTLTTEEGIIIESMIYGECGC
ncbi:hypothetical protein [Chryseobacterium sp. A321]